MRGFVLVLFNKLPISSVFWELGLSGRNLTENAKFFERSPDIWRYFLSNVDLYLGAFKIPDLISRLLVHIHDSGG